MAANGNAIRPRPGRVSRPRHSGLTGAIRWSTAGATAFEHRDSPPCRKAFWRGGFGSDDDLHRLLLADVKDALVTLDLILGTGGLSGIVRQFDSRPALGRHSLADQRE